MAVSCYIKIIDDTRGTGWSPVITFQEVPRVGEFVTFSREGKRDERGVLHGDLFRVQHVTHTAATDLSPPMITLDVVAERYADRT
jgi:hypothetical protein